ncbi:MAG: pyroglutamyl-peptidase I [Oscillospiraceae bacterium]|nr:pyroglutamyl-peptidase I [Oscillospiraceae bacterium]
MNILMTGFEPFGGEKVNPSWEAVCKLPDALPGTELRKLRLPTAFKTAAELACGEISAFKPDIVLCTGQAGGCAAVRIERVAINLRDARIPDNVGFQPTDEPIARDGPAAYFSTLPTRRLLDRLRDGGIAAELSYSAGTFVCNELMYSVLHYAARNAPEMRAGFVHVPYLPEQAEAKSAKTASMPLAEMVRSLSIILSELTGP